MALSQLTPITSPCCCCYPEDPRKTSTVSSNVSASLPGRDGLFPLELRSRRRMSRIKDVVVVDVRGRTNVSDAQTASAGAGAGTGIGVESNNNNNNGGGQIRSGVEIPVTCYQIIGVSNQAEKDEIVKSVMNLRNAEVEEGYTLEAVLSRQELLMDVRDKLLFEPEYAGDLRGKVEPKSSLRIPWSWVPGALCLLQEAGEEKLVLEIGRAALQHPEANPFSHDLLLSMALAECAIAKTWFEKNKVSQGFEALARAQYLLKSKVSLGNMPLLFQIEESLEDLAPACTLEILDMPHTPENSERRRGAIAALRELLSQGLDVELSCQVRDWPCFLSQALHKLMAAEIVDLLPWDNIAVARKNRKSLESQNQRAVIDFNCFYTAMIAHIAIGVSNKQTNLIDKAKVICECLVASEGFELKFEDALCSFLLGQGSETEAVDRLRELETDSGPASRHFMPTNSEKEVSDGLDRKPSLEKWLKEAVLDLFPDTRDCSPSLDIFFKGEKRTLGHAKQSVPIPKTYPSVSRKTSFIQPNRVGLEESTPHLNFHRNIGKAVTQLSPTNMQSPLTAVKSSGSNAQQSVQLKRKLGSHHENFLESWPISSSMVGRVTLVTVVGCIAFMTFNLLGTQIRQRSSRPQLHSTKLKPDSSSWTRDPSVDYNVVPACIGQNKIAQSLRDLLTIFDKKMKQFPDEGTFQSSVAVDDLFLLSNMPQKRLMPVEEAEALVKQWQAIKAEALGPEHQVHILPEILAEPMLVQWQALAESAKTRSCFWRFVLLQLSVLRAEILFDGNGSEMAEIEALLEEAAELVDDSQAKNPNYYSTYKIRYVLKRQDDGPWLFCRWGILTPT